MSRISVYGSSGFIGSRFCEMYLEEIARIPREIVRPAHSKEVLYLIGTTNNYNVFDDPFIDIETNLSYLIEVLDECRFWGIKTFNFVSSWFVYGDTKLPFKETSCCKPKGFYSITKKCAEDLLISYCRTYGIRYRIFRLCGVYGENDKFSSKKNALQYLINEMIYDRPISLYFGGDFFRDYMYVDDVCRAMMLCMNIQKANYIINIGSGIPYRFANLINMAKEMVGSNSVISSVAPSKFHKIVQVKDFVMDTEKLKFLGFRPEVDITEGLRRVIEKMKKDKENG